MATPKKTGTTQDTQGIELAKTISKPEATKGPKGSIIAFVVFTVAWVGLSMIAAQYIIGFPMLWLLGDKFSLPLWTCIYDALVYILVLIMVILIPPKLWALWQKRKQTEKNKKENDSNDGDKNPLATNRTEIGFKTLPTFVDIGLAPVGYVLYMIIAMLLTNIMTLFPWFDINQAQDVGFNFFLTSGDRILAMLALVFIAPFAEEIIMRGWLYGKLRSKIKIIPAMLLVSVLFGFLHGQWNVAISTFSLSLVLCSLREITGTIWSGIFVHMLMNGIAFYLLYVAGI